MLSSLRVLYDSMFCDKIRKRFPILSRQLKYIKTSITTIHANKRIIFIDIAEPIHSEKVGHTIFALTKGSVRKNAIKKYNIFFMIFLSINKIYHPIVFIFLNCWNGFYIFNRICKFLSYFS